MTIAQRGEGDFRDAFTHAAIGMTLTSLDGRYLRAARRRGRCGPDPAGSREHRAERVRSRARESEGGVRIGARVLPGDAAVEIAIADTGPGIDPAVQSRICDPFFTTKFTGRGLGLSAALGIMKAHRGTIHVASALGADTVVTVVVPAVDTARCA